MPIPPLCWSCGGVARLREPLCAACRRLLRRLAPDPVVLAGVRTWAPLAYAGPARDLVRALKFRGAAAVADTMAAQIAANAPEELLARGAPELLARGSPELLARGSPELLAWGALVPVPLHPRRLRKRGYNQAALVAGALAGRTGLDVADCLARSGPVVTQVGRDRRERRAGLAGRVCARGPVPERALLVDDVATTGATLATCAAALRAAGSVEVAALAFARTIGR